MEVVVFLATVWSGTVAACLLYYVPFWLLGQLWRLVEHLARLEARR